MQSTNLSYRISDRTLCDLASLERNTAILDQNEIVNRAAYRISSEAQFEDLFAINHLLGIGLTLGEIKQISIGKGVATKETQILFNIRQVFDFVRNNFKKDQLVFNFHFIQHVIKLLQTNMLDIWEIGKIRLGDEITDKAFELDNQHYATKDISNMLADVVLWLENEEEVHPVVKATVFMMFLNGTSPFMGVNFVSSIVFFRLILEKHGYGNHFNIPLFKIFDNPKYDIKNILNQSLDQQSSSGITDVLSYVSQELNTLIAEYKTRFIQFDYFDIKSDIDKLDLNERQTKLLKLLQHKVSIKRREYIKLFKVAPMTGYRDLNYLVHKRLLVISGQGKSTTYTLITKI
jgi:DNA-binding transcriptional MerR regulator